MSKKKIGAIAVIVVILASAVWWRAARSKQAGSTAQTETVVVKKGALQTTVDTTGKLAPSAEMALSFSAGGTVADVLAKVGDHVQAGQPLVVLDTSDLALQLSAAETSRDSAKSTLASARSGLAELQAGPDAAELETAKLQLDKARDSRLGVQASRDATCGRVEKSDDKSACVGANASVLQAEDSVRLAELDYQKVQGGASAADLSAARDKVRQAESQVASAENQVKQAQLKLQQATLVTPITGTVTTLDVQPGGRAGSGTTVATVSDLSSMDVQITLDQTDVARVAVGQKTEVKVDAFSDKPLAGEVMTIAPVGQTQSGVVLFPVTVRLAATEVPLRPGMTADASILISRTEQALILPRRAIQTVGQRSFVQVKSDAGTRRVPVKLGATTDSEAQVLGDVAEGDVVVISTAATTGARARTTPGAGQRGPGGFGGGFGGFGGGGRP